MKSYHHILVPIDGSDYAKQALQHAIDIAKLTGASITLLNVANMADIINQFSQMENTSELTIDELSATAQANSTGLLKEFASLVPASIPVQSLFELSAPEVSIYKNKKLCQPTSSAWAAAVNSLSRISCSAVSAPMSLPTHRARSSWLTTKRKGRTVTSWYP